jgi:hypothetical protein
MNAPTAGVSTPSWPTPAAVPVGSEATATKSHTAVGIAAGRVLRRWYRGKKLTKLIIVTPAAG